MRKRPNRKWSTQELHIEDTDANANMSVNAEAYSDYDVECIG